MNREFFYNTPNCIEKWIDCSKEISNAVRLISVDDYRPGSQLNLAMDDEANVAIAYLEQEIKKSDK